MATSTILSDNGVSSGTSGIKTSGGNDGTLVLQTTTAAGAATTALTLGTDQSATFAQGVSMPGSFAFKNRIINGAMMIDQRNAGAAISSLVQYTTYIVDRWFYYGDQASKFSAQQNAGSVTPPVGFTNYLGLTSLSAYTVGSSENFVLSQRIEGSNCADLAWGTANAKTVTLSFWVYSSLTGTFGGSIQNSAANRSYPFSYTISSANTWTQISITINGDTTGTWLTTNGIGIKVIFGLGVGSSNSGTSGVWSANAYSSATGATSVVGTNGATFYITGVQLEVGSTATSFDYRPYGTELALCQRYYAKIGAGGFSNYNSVAVGYVYLSTAIIGIVNYPVSMRAAATINYSNVRLDAAAGTTNAVSSINGVYAGTNSLMATFNATGSTMTVGQGGMIICNNNSAGYIDLSAEL